MYLLDTHILLWWVGGAYRFSSAVQKIFDKTSPEQPLLLSVISLWEIAMLKALGRIELHLPVREWLEIASAPPLIQCQTITPAIAAEVAQLPREFQRDPADRLIVATGRVVGATVITLDQRICDSKLVSTIS